MNVENALPDFNNSKNAFAWKTDAEIRQGYWLFRLIQSPTLVRYGSALTQWSLNLGLPVKGLIKTTLFRQFCGGEDITECSKTIERLGQQGVGSILDYSVEGKEDEHEFDQSCAEILRTVERASGDPNIPFSVFKVTGLARFGLLEKVSEGKELGAEEAEEYQKVKNRVQRICEKATSLGVKIFIDAEESWIQPAIDHLAETMMKAFNKHKAIVFNTVQLYRHDRLAFLEKSIHAARTDGYYYGVKLVRGAYMEKERERAMELNYPSPIQIDKASCDRDYDRAITICIEHIERISFCAGTHNEESSLLLSRLMKEKGLSPSDPRIYFSQLLGMSDHISFNLAHHGFKVAKYVPYGPVAAVVPYLTRRAQENTSIAGQMGRELRLLQSELKRRKLT